jgi:hypothetical protein
LFPIHFVLNFLLLALLWFYLCNIGRLQFYVHVGDLIWSELLFLSQEKIDEQIISQRINGIDNNLQFKITTEVNNTINYLDILIRRNIINITIELYRKTINAVSPAVRQSVPSVKLYELSDKIMSHRKQSRITFLLSTGNFGSSHNVFSRFHGRIEHQLWPAVKTE